LLTTKRLTASPAARSMRMKESPDRSTSRATTPAASSSATSRFRYQSKPFPVLAVLLRYRTTRVSKWPGLLLRLLIAEVCAYALFSHAERPRQRDLCNVVLKLR